MKNNTKKVLILFILSMGTVGMYNLPYMKSVFYEPLRQALGLSHQELGGLLGLYGKIAMVMYFPGGWLADKLDAKKLMSFSLVTSGLIGIYFSTFPSYSILKLIFMVWGITTILTFWAVIIKVIRMLGDSSEQGKLFGFYGGFQGIAGTIISFVGLYFFNKAAVPAVGVKYVIIINATVSIICGIITYLIIEEKEDEDSEQIDLKLVPKVLKMPKAWLIGIIIFSQYMVFSSLTYLSPYLENVFKLSAGVVATLSIIRTYGVKMAGGPLFGFIADKIGSATKVLFTGFILALVNIIAFMLIPGTQTLAYLAVINMLVLTIILFGLNGILYAPIAESNIPLVYTGTVVGLASLIGYIPDAFFWNVVGGWLDKYGDKGYTYLFMLCFSCCLVGITASYTLLRINNKEKMGNNIIINNKETAA